MHYHMRMGNKAQARDVMRSRVLNEYRTRESADHSPWRAT